MPSPRRFLIDTDLNFDDAMAILYLLRHPDAEVRGITVTGTGLTRLPAGAQNALRLLELASHPSIPVAAGALQALTGTQHQDLPQDWRDDADSMMELELPPTSCQPDPLPAPELLCQLVGEASQPLTILALGPLTNLALALRDKPELAPQIERIVIMGGALDVPGNVQDGGVEQNQFAEWNLYLDPLAAQEVFASGVPITLVPLDATNGAPITSAHEAAFAKAARTPAGRFVSTGLTRLKEREALDDWYYFWDPLAAAIALEPDLASVEDLAVEALTEPGPLFGRIVRSQNGRTVQLARSADAERFAESLLSTLNLPHHS